MSDPKEVIGAYNRGVGDTHTDIFSVLRSDKADEFIEGLKKIKDAPSIEVTLGKSVLKGIDLSKSSENIMPKEVAQLKQLEFLREEYATQDNRATAYPIYVAVQELIPMGVMDDDYSCFGDSEIIDEYVSLDYEGTFKSESAIRDQINEDFGHDESQREKYIEDIKRLPMAYVWTDVEIFLTIKGARAFMKSNSHNMGKTRTYVKHFHRRNYEMRTFLSNVGMKVED